MLELKDVDVFYGAAQALHGVSLTVREGEIVALLGSNGAGKTTILSAISGLIHPRRGQILFRGQPLQKERPDHVLRLGIAHCPEGRHIWPRLTVREHLVLGAYVRKDQAAVRREVEEILTLFPVLKHKVAKPASSLSGGQQQMLAIGRALLSKPRLLLLDEPSLGLAPLMVQDIMTIIRQLGERGATVLLVEQNAQSALRVSHRGYVLETGRIVLEDRADRLLADPAIRHAYLGTG